MLILNCSNADFYAQFQELLLHQNAKKLKNKLGNEVTCTCTNVHACSIILHMGHTLTVASYYRYVSGLDGLKRLQTVRFDDETLVTPELNVYQPSSIDPPPLSDPTDTTTTTNTTVTSTSTFPDPNSYVSSQPSTSTATLDDLSIVSSLLGSLPDGLTVPGFTDTDY